jgi:hypothetical protein
MTTEPVIQRAGTPADASKLRRLYVDEFKPVTYQMQEKYRRAPCHC